MAIGNAIVIAIAITISSGKRQVPVSCIDNEALKYAKNCMQPAAVADRMRDSGRLGGGGADGAEVVDQLQQRGDKLE